MELPERLMIVCEEHVHTRYLDIDAIGYVNFMKLFKLANDIAESSVADLESSERKL